MSTLHPELQKEILKILSDSSVHEIEFEDGQDKDYGKRANKGKAHPNKEN